MEEVAEMPGSVDDAAGAVADLDGESIAAETRPQYEALFRRAQELLRGLEGDERVGPQERAALEQHVRDIVREARMEYDRKRSAAAGQLAAAAERLELAAESLAQAEGIEAIQNIRADLRLIRDGITAAAHWAARDAHARTWAFWQTLNQQAWNALNERWKDHERILGALLDRAEGDLERGDPRSSKNHIKEFHDTAKHQETSHAALKALRSRARAMWERATVAASEQHEAYLAIARRRLDNLRGLLVRTESTLGRVESEIAAAELHLRDAQTDVAAALARGRLEERRKELRRLTDEASRLRTRIGQTEETLS